MKTKRFVSTLLALLLICSLPLSAFADTWYLENGDITVNATESGQTVTQGAQVDVPDSAPVITQSDSSTPTTNTISITAAENATANVTIQDVNIVISPSFDATNYKGQAAVTINVADNATANVTLDGVSIDTQNTGGAIIFDAPQNQSITSGYAAIQITGNGDVTMELDGENTVQSGYQRAGVEKNTTDDTGKGNLTITDENGTAGSLNATGGYCGAGIGGGSQGNGSNITVSGDAQVKSQGGNSNAWNYNYFGAGAAIGNGGKYSNSSPDNIAGDEVTPNTDVLTTNGKIEYYAPGADMKTDDPIKTVTGTYVPPQDEEKPPVDEEKPPVDEEKPDQPAQPTEESAAEAVYTAPLYRVVNQDGKDILHQDAWKDGVLTITVDADFAALTGKLGGIQTLKAQGVDTIVFVTKNASSTFALSDLLSQGSTGDTYTLTHDGAAVTFTLGAGKTDVSDILAKPRTKQRYRFPSHPPSAHTGRMRWLGSPWEGESAHASL